jgi:hypothetical protein
MMCINDFLLLLCNTLFTGDASNAKVIASGTTGDCSWTLTADGVLTVSGNGAMAGYEPDTMPWRDYAEDIRTAVIMQGVMNIGDFAFFGCHGLTSIIIPNSVKNIGRNAFIGCNGLTSIIIPDSVTNIGDYAFHGCSSLTSIIIPDSVTYIGDYAFYGCSSLTSIIIPDSVTNIGSFAFEYCNGLKSITIPNSVTSIGYSAFFYLTVINVEDSNTAYSSVDGILFNKDKTTLIAYPRDRNGNYCIPDSVINIDYGAFFGSDLTSVTIPDSVTNIGNIAFAFCHNLTSIIIPNSVTSIGKCAFKSCSGLTSIIIPDSVTSIGYHAFEGCSSLTSIINLNAIPQHAPKFIFTGIDTKNCVLQVPANAVSIYKSTHKWKTFKNIIAIEEGAT